VKGSSFGRGNVPVTEGNEEEEETGQPAHPIPIQRLMCGDVCFVASVIRNQSDCLQGILRRNHCMFVRLDVFTAVTMKNAVFWDIKTQFVLHRRNITSPLQSPAR
jgi:hypothetical protein